MSGPSSFTSRTSDQAFLIDFMITLVHGSQISEVSTFFSLHQVQESLDLLHKRRENKHSEKVERERPSPQVLELDPVAISGSLMEIRSRAATSSAEASWG